MLYTGEFYDRYHEGKLYYLVPNDINFWIEIAKKYGDPILELASGTGRISIPLAEKGFRVTGLEISQSMIERARQKSDKVEWLEADIRAFHLQKKFKLIIFPYLTINTLLKVEEIESMLDCVKKHLEPDGRLVIDLISPTPKFLLDLFLGSDRRMLDCIFSSPDGKGNIVSTMIREYESAEQTIAHKLFYNIPGEAEEVTEELKARLYFPQEIDTLLKYNGFTIEHKFGDYDQSPFVSESPYQIIICQVNR
jgi:2-polyprenyl-3-methyl-5-hydroxy-6-metoxy-1,4-benzoquinol methylase